MDNAISFPDTTLLDSGSLGWIAFITIEKVRPDHLHYAEFFCILTSLINSVTALQANEIILF